MELLQEIFGKIFLIGLLMVLVLCVIAPFYVEPGNSRNNSNNSEPSE